MQASVTTENIQAEPKEPKLIGGHNHRRNFNRYVAGCPECMRRCPDGPPPNGYLGKKPRNRLSAEKLAVKTKEVIEETQEQLEQKAADILARLEAANKRAADAEAAVVEKQDPLNALVQIMLRREAKTAAKEEDAEQRKELARQDMIRVAEHTERIKRETQAACRHVKENGTPSVGGQVCNNGLYYALCTRCGFEFPPAQPSRELAAQRLG